MAKELSTAARVGLGASVALPLVVLAGLWLMLRPAPPAGAPPAAKPEPAREAAAEAPPAPSPPMAAPPQAAPAEPAPAVELPPPPPPMVMDPGALPSPLNGGYQTRGAAGAVTLDGALAGQLAGARDRARAALDDGPEALGGVAVATALSALPAAEREAAWAELKPLYEAELTLAPGETPLATRDGAGGAALYLMRRDGDSVIVRRETYVRGEDGWTPRLGGGRHEIMLPAGADAAATARAAIAGDLRLAP